MASCRTCGADVPTAARFCPACGAALHAPLAGDERKLVTVLFADLVDSTARADGRDPEDVRAVLQPYFGIVRAELDRFGGTFEKFIGDAVMALFGAPVAYEDDPERAVRAALAIRDAVTDAGLDVRVGVDTGEAVVALGARPREGEGMAHGDVVNVASRIQAAADVNTVLVGAGTYTATRDAIEYGEPRLIEAKGKSEPIRVHEALRTRTPRAAAYEGARLAPLVGRRDELALILATLARAKRDRAAQLVTVTGAPGIGKSRLAWELQVALDDTADPVAWRRGRSLPYGDGITFWALGEMAKAEAGILETDPPDEAAAKLARAVRDVVGDGDAERVETHLRPLVGLTTDAAAGERREEAFAAWRRFFEALADRSLLVLVFEDLHWADDGLLDFVEYLAKWASAPLVLLCTARPELHERRPAWGGRRNAATISLPPLSPEETARLVAFLVRRLGIPAELQEELLARAEGNPLYAEEFVRMLAHRDGGELALPESLHGIIAARLDALSVEEKALLHAAAVVGRNFWPGALAVLSREQRAVVEERLHALARKEFVRRWQASSVAGETEYVFHHALVRDVAYAQITRARRIEMHCLAAEWVASLGRAEDHSETLAHHYLAALEYARASGQDGSRFADRARIALREAGDRALALHSYAAAARYYLTALEIWPRDDRDRPQLLLACGKARVRADAAGGDLLTEATELLLEQGDREGAAEAEIERGRLMLGRGEGERAFEHLERAVELVRDAPPSRTKTRALLQLAGFRMMAAEAEEAAIIATGAMRMAEDLGLEELRATALNLMGFARVSRGDLGGVADLEESVEAATRANAAFSATAYINLGSALANLGDLRRASDAYAEARRLAAEFGDAARLDLLEGDRLLEHYWTGRWDEAIALAEQLAPDGDSRVPPRIELMARIVRGRIRLARDDLDGALADAKRARDLSRTTAEPQHVFPAVALAARAALDAGRDSEAAALVNELLGLWAARPAFLPSLWATDLAVVMSAVGRPRDFVSAATAAVNRTPWLDAAVAIAQGETATAADLYARIGAEPEEAYARLRAAGAAALTGDEEQASEQLRRSLRVYRRVRARRYLREAESLAAVRA